MASTRVEKAKSATQERSKVEQRAVHTGSDSSYDNDAAVLAGEMRKKVTLCCLSARLVASD